MQALRGYVATVADETLRAQLGSGASEVARVISAVRERFPELPEPASGRTPEEAQFRLFDAVTTFLKNLCPDTVRLEVTSCHGAEPYLVSPEGPLAQASLRALKTAFDQDPVLLREGGSIPIVTEFQQVLKADSLLLGLGLPDDNPHSPNEKFDLECFERGQLMSAYLWQELAGRTESGSD